MRDIIWKKSDMNANFSVYFQNPVFPIIDSSEANNRIEKRQQGRGGHAALYPPTGQYPPQNGKHIIQAVSKQ